MKNIFKILLFNILLVSGLASCESDKVSDPDAQISVNNDNPSVGEPITFTVDGNAETYAIFTGDSGHDYINSQLAVTVGQDLDQELVYLVADSIPSVRPWLEFRIDDYNSTVGVGQQLDIDAVMLEIESFIGVEYDNKLKVAFEIYLIIPELQGFTARSLVDNFFVNESVLLAPSGGFSTGFPVDRYDKVLEYTYSEPGMYNVTLVASNVGNSSNDYETKYAFSELIITVDP